MPPAIMIGETTSRIFSDAELAIFKAASYE